jgi:hypothetical protein
VVAVDVDIVAARLGDANNRTPDYGPLGREAVTRRLLKEGAQAGNVPDVGEKE